MSLRAIFLIPAKKEAHNVFFARYFPSVETRCRLKLGDLYVKIPPEKELIKLLFTELGISDEDRFVETRDQCDREPLYPAYQLETKSGVLWPVVIMEKESFIYCAIPYEENASTVMHHSSKVHLISMLCVSMGIEVLNGLAKCVTSHTNNQGVVSKEELLKYVTISLPFGRPICNDSHIADNLCSSTVVTKSKIPAWNPVPHKGKSYVALQINEEVRSMQFNRANVADLFDIYGHVSYQAEVEGVAPEVSVVLTYDAKYSGSELVVGPLVSVETITPITTCLRFCPSRSQTLCYYKLRGAEQPVLGTFSAKIGEDSIINIHIQLCLNKNVKGYFKRFEVHIPCSEAISAVRSNCSQGSLTSGSNNSIVWVIGSKFPKTLSAVLRAKVKLKKNQTKAHKKQLTDCASTSLISDVDGDLDNQLFPYALVKFTIPDYTYSGTKLDVQSVVVSTTSKISRTVSYEFKSGMYKIWNSASDDYFPDDLSEDLKNVLSINTS